MTSPKEEAEIIANLIQKEFGTQQPNYGRPAEIVMGREAINWMIDNDIPSWKEVKWEAFYFKHKIQALCEKNYENIEPIKLRKLYLVKGNYLWDARLRSNSLEHDDVILMSTNNLNNLLETHGSYGLIIGNAVLTPDISYEFYRWIEEKKGGPSDYVIKRMKEGRPPRMRNTDFMISDLQIFHFTKENFQTGLKEGWLKDDFQETMRQQDGGKRGAKYLIKLGKIPQKYRVCSKNLNYDPDDYEEEYPDEE